MHVHQVFPLLIQLLDHFSSGCFRLEHQTKVSPCSFYFPIKPVLLRSAGVVPAQVSLLILRFRCLQLVRWDQMPLSSITPTPKPELQVSDFLSPTVPDTDEKFRGALKKWLVFSGSTPCEILQTSKSYTLPIKDYAVSAVLGSDREHTARLMIWYHLFRMFTLKKWGWPNPNLFNLISLYLASYFYITFTALRLLNMRI